MWTKYEVTMDFLTKLCGSVPGDPEMVAKWVETRLKRKKVRAPDSMSIDEIAQEVLSSLPEEEEQAGLLVFQRQEGGLVVRLATVRAHFKDCADKISKYYVGKVEGESSFKAKVLNGVYYDPSVYWLPIV